MLQNDGHLLGIGPGQPFGNVDARPGGEKGDVEAVALGQAEGRYLLQRGAHDAAQGVFDNLLVVEEVRLHRLGCPAMPRAAAPVTL